MALVLLPEFSQLGVGAVHGFGVAGVFGACRNVYQFTGSSLYSPPGVPGGLPGAVTFLLLRGHQCSGDPALLYGSRRAAVEEYLNPVIVRPVWREEYSICFAQFEPELAGAIGTLVLDLADSRLVKGPDRLDYGFRVVRSRLDRLDGKDGRLD